MTRTRFVVVVVAVLLGASMALAKKDPPPGVIAASAGQAVVLVDPVSGSTRSFEAGTVGWLYEGPAGALFAPDLLAGRTTVLDLRLLAVKDRFDGITTPHFGPKAADRYVVVAGDVLMVSYPDRAPIMRVDADIAFPWQVVMISDSVLVVLERGRDGRGEPVLTAVDIVTAQVVYRRALSSGVRRLALSRELGLIAFADADDTTVRLVEPATLRPIAVLTAAGPAADVVFLEGHSTVAAVSTVGESGGELRVWRLKAKKGTLKVKKEQSLVLESTPVRVDASPGGDRLAVACRSGVIQVVSVDTLELQHTVELPGAPRDMVWCDPTRPGPTLPEWSSDEQPELRLDP